MQIVAENEDRAQTDIPSGTKLCPFCAERIQVLAIKCRHCGEFLNRPSTPAPKSGGKWYFSTTSLVLALLSFGPLALPMVWYNPRLKIRIKAAVTAATIILTIGLCWLMMLAYAHLLNQIESLGI